MIKIHPAKKISGSIEVPGDKSISHRALILASLAKGISEVHGLSNGADVKATRKILTQLGAKITFKNNTALVESNGAKGLATPEDKLDCHNSGTSARLLTGVLAPQPFTSVIDGDHSLRRRPMDRIIHPLQQMGAQISGQEQPTHLPLKIVGKKLKGIHYEMPIASAQVKSAVLFAGLFAEGETSVTEPLPSRDHTERLFDWLELPITRSRLTHRISSSEVPNFSLTVPGDFSSAAYFIALGLLHPDAEMTISKVNLNPTRAAFLDVLRRMGGYIQLDVTEHRPELIGNITVRSSRLTNTSVDTSEIPLMIDELPLLAVVAALSQGTLEIGGASELRVKESDRIKAIVSQLRLMNANIEEKEDGFIVEGGRSLKGAGFESSDDHRILMSLAVAASLAEGPSELHGEEWVAVSYPDFFKTLDAIAD